MFNGLDIVYALGAAATSPVWGYRMLRTGKWRTDWGGRLGKCEAMGAGIERVLIHAVSVGEVNAIRQLVKMLGEMRPGLEVVVSTTTDTGYARAKEVFGERRVIRYPLDFRFAVRRVLDAVGPSVVALVELEVWPQFVGECARRGVAVCVVNGRLSGRSFGRYRKVGFALRSTFGKLAAAGVQTGVYGERFAAMGVRGDRVRVLDTMKWDTAQIADEVEGAEGLAKEMGIDRSRPVIVAGSTGPGEERLLIDTCPAEAQLVLVPRKPERFEEVARLMAGMVRRTDWRGGKVRAVDGQRVFLVDTMGELRKAYALADVALVGRSFLGMYGSDLIEPVALGRPTVIGPHYGDFQEVVEALVEGGGVVVSGEPGRAAAELLADGGKASALARAGRAVILSRQGATGRYARMIVDLLGGDDRV
jgi:3-deoxy-D-manno-octulosonic-acid transferase